MNRHDGMGLVKPHWQGLSAVLFLTLFTIVTIGCYLNNKPIFTKLIFADIPLDVPTKTGFLGVGKRNGASV
jgi:hypothetical protein